MKNKGYAKFGWRGGNMVYYGRCENGEYWFLATSEWEKINRVKDLHCFIFKRLPLIAFPFLVARETSCKLFVPWF